MRTSPPRPASAATWASPRASWRGASGTRGTGKRRISHAPEWIAESGGLEKTYRFFRLRDVTLRLPRGGSWVRRPEGVGKSTTLRASDREGSAEGSGCIDRCLPENRCAPSDGVLALRQWRSASRTESNPMLELPQMTGAHVAPHPTNRENNLFGLPLLAVYLQLR
jgi:hypothetical protein